MYYAVTLTASPHKDRFKKLSWSEQEQKYIDFFNSIKHLFLDFIYVFETCPTSGLRHVHLLVQPNYTHEEYNCDDIMHTIFRDSFIAKFGYHDNPIAHFFDKQPLLSLLDLKRWEDYMYKLMSSVKLF